MEIRITTERDVYEPAADTELLVKSIRLREGERVLEIGTGTGIIAIHCAKHGCRVTATDVVEEALELAREKNSPIFVVQHHPLYYDTPDQISLPVDKRNELLALFEECGVVAVLDDDGGVGRAHHHRVTDADGGAV